MGGGRLHDWVEGLNRYVALSLVLVPLAILEPVKPVGFYLTAKGHLVSGGGVIVIGEIIKVTPCRAGDRDHRAQAPELSLVCLDV